MDWDSIERPWAKHNFSGRHGPKNPRLNKAVRGLAGVKMVSLVATESIGATTETKQLEVCA